jgi:hypothetical protein
LAEERGSNRRSLVRRTTLFETAKVLSFPAIAEADEQHEIETI